MVFAKSQMPAMDFAFPDVCLTPIVVPVPIPYPNIALSATAIPTQFKNLILAMPEHNLTTMAAMSFGDNAGVNLNPISGMFMGPGRNLMGSTKVFCGGLPATRMLDPTGQNGVSPGAFGLTLTPSQTKVMILA
jgi:hypothetical protein